ncbi:hypothetical protein ElyMa_007048900 [Elysia marginata]|uniref:Uncharacterized protein n=1 Tax=Elysia marginata TaxID=1093978 RepID=A0AAV4JY35_9GAST|nr:hypothetical protein ElyMa_007048900 [Elysia marginata]
MVNQLAVYTQSCPKQDPDMLLSTRVDSGFSPSISDNVVASRLECPGAEVSRARQQTRTREACRDTAAMMTL